MRGQSCGLRLYRLRTADLSAISSYRTVERHVLRLEGNHCNILSHQPAAKRCDKRALACIGRRTLNHHRDCIHLFIPLNATSNLAQLSSLLGMPKRRLAGASNRRVRIPCFARV